MSDSGNWIASVDVFFRGTQRLMTAEHNDYVNALNRWEEIAVGDYVVVRCLIGMTGGTSIGVREVHVLQVALAKPVTRESFNRCAYGFIDTGTPCSDPDIKIDRLPPDSLTRAQCREVIRGIIHQSRWWWLNASREAKAVLQAEFSKGDQARAHLRDGVSAWERGDSTRARQLLHQAITLLPDISGARVELGKIAIAESDIDAAVRWFQEELTQAKDSQSLSAHSYLAAVHEAQGNSSAAEAHAREAIHTEAYQRAPSALRPDVVAEIRRAVSCKRTR